MDQIESRRDLLQRGSAALAVTLTGCSSLSDSGTQSDSDSSLDCDVMDIVSIEAELTTRSRVEQASSDLAIFSDLSSEKQEIIRTAIEDTEYRKCYFKLDSPEQEAISSLSRQGCYVKRDDNYYRLSGIILDTTFC